MNFFEQQMRSMFSDKEIITEDAQYVGKTMLSRLDDDLLVKVQFVSTHVAKQYDAIRVRIINRTEGEVDTETMLFADIIGLKDGNVKPYMWECDNKGRWYTPVSNSEIEAITRAVIDYIAMYL